MFKNARKFLLYMAVLPLSFAAAAPAFAQSCPIPPNVPWPHPDVTNLPPVRGGDPGTVFTPRPNPPVFNGGPGKFPDPCDATAGGGGYADYALGDPLTLPGAECLKTVWAPTNEEACSMAMDALRDGQADSINQPESLDHRKRCAQTPDGKTVVEYVQYPKTYVSLMNYWKEFAAADAARISMDLLVPEDYEYWSSGRLALGMAVAEPGHLRGCFSGGCLPENQTGSSIRLQYSYDNNRTCWHPMIYDYALNRNTKIDEDHGSNWEGGTVADRSFGRNTRTNGCQPLGKWVTISMDMVLNTFTATGQPIANGTATINMYDKETGTLIGTNSINNAVWRSDPKWKILGPFFTDKTTFHQQSPDQLNSMYMANYNMSVLDTAKPNCAIQSNGNAVTDGTTPVTPPVPVPVDVVAEATENLNDCDLTWGGGTGSNIDCTQMPGSLTAEEISGGIQVSSAAQLRSALQAASPGDVIVLAPGNYGNVDLSGISKSGEVKIGSANPANPAVFTGMTMNNVRNITLNGIKFQYNGPNKYGPDAILELSRATNVQVLNSLFEGKMVNQIGANATPHYYPNAGSIPNLKKSIGSGLGLSVNGSENVLISGSTFYNLQVGSNVNTASNSKLIGNSYRNISLDAMDFGGVENFLVEGNTVANMSDPPGQGHGDMIQIRNFGTPVNNLIIRNNILVAGPDSEGDMHEIYAGNPVATTTGNKSDFFKDITVEGNKIYGAQFHGITLGQTVGANVINNTLLQDCSNTSSTNTVKKPHVVISDESTGVRVTGNTLLDDPRAWGRTGSIGGSGTITNGASNFNAAIPGSWVVRPNTIVKGSGVCVTPPNVQDPPGCTSSGGVPVAQ